MKSKFNRLFGVFVFIMRTMCLVLSIFYMTLTGFIFLSRGTIEKEFLDEAIILLLVGLVHLPEEFR